MIKWDRIHYSWWDFVQECNQNNEFWLIVAPMGHGKSVNYAVSYPLWWLGRNKNKRIQILSNTDDNAMKRVKAIKAYIEHSQTYHDIFPEIIPDKESGWTDHDIHVVRDYPQIDPSVSAYGILSSGTGSRCDQQILDDPVDEDNAIRQPQKQKQIISKYFTSWFTRVQKPLFKKGFAGCIGTKYADNDLISIIENRNIFRVLLQGITPNMKTIASVTKKYDSKKRTQEIVKVEDIPLWAEYDEKELVLNRETMGSRIFNKTMRNILDEDSSGVLSDFEKCKFNYTLEEVRQLTYIHWAGVDFSSQKRPGNVCVVIGMTHDGKRVPVDIQRVKTSAQIISMLDIIETRYHPMEYVLEDIGVQDTLIGFIRLHGELNPQQHQWSKKLMPFTTDQKIKYDVFAGIPSLNTQFANHGWIFPVQHIFNHEDSCECEWCTLYEDMKMYPMPGRSYDILLAMFFAYFKSMTVPLRMDYKKHEVRVFQNIRGKEF